MQRIGFYLTNQETWGVHEPGTLLAPLSIHSLLNDFIINKAKEVAKRMEVEGFDIVHINIFGATDVVYTSK